MAMTAVRVVVNRILDLFILSSSFRQRVATAIYSEFDMSVQMFSHE
jgi:hypothetical protein